MPRTRLDPRARMLASLAYVFLGVPGALLFGIGAILFSVTSIRFLTDSKFMSLEEISITAGIGAACFLIGYLMYTCAAIAAKEPQYRIPGSRLLPLIAFDFLHLLIAIAAVALGVVALAVGSVLCGVSALVLGWGTFFAVRKRKLLLRKWRAELVDIPQPWAGPDHLHGENPR